MSAREMFTHALHVAGCDDSTTVGLSLTMTEARFLDLVVEKVTDAGADNGCKPTMGLYAADAGGWEADYAWGRLDEEDA